MDKAIKTSLMKALKEGWLYDWIVDNQYDLTREELATIAAETAFCLFQDDDPKPTLEQRRESLALQIDEIYIVEEEDE